eukprot:2134694-Rhodomonas_salina.2
MKHFHVQINARNGDDLDEAAIMKKVQSAGGKPCCGTTWKQAHHVHLHGAEPKTHSTAMIIIRQRELQRRHCSVSAAAGWNNVVPAEHTRRMRRQRALSEVQNAAVDEDDWASVNCAGDH